MIREKKNGNDCKRRRRNQERKIWELENRQRKMMTR